MKEFLDKISSYNLFNYFFPGVLFAILSEKITSFSLIQDDLLLGIFAYYFIGLVISRFGSLVIEPLLKKISFLNFADYAMYISATKKDGKIELLSEVNNMYRTICSMCVLLPMLKLYELMQSWLYIPKNVNIYILILLLLLIFLFSYKKQTSYLFKRIVEKGSKK